MSFTWLAEKFTGLFTRFNAYEKQQSPQGQADREEEARSISISAAQGEAREVAQRESKRRAAAKVRKEWTGKGGATVRLRTRAAGEKQRISPVEKSRVSALWAAFFAAEVPAPTIDVTPDDDFLTHPSLITSLLFNKRVLLPASIGWGMVRAAPGRAVAKVLERVTKWRRRRRFEQIKRAKKKQHEEKEKHLEGLWRAEQTWLEAKQYLYTYELPPALCLNPAVCQAVVGTVHQPVPANEAEGKQVLYPMYTEHRRV
jgi:hypothetical protein